MTSPEAMQARARELIAKYSKADPATEKSMDIADWIAAALSAAAAEADKQATERAAKIAERQYASDKWHSYYRQAGWNIAAAIRSGGQHDR